MALSDIGFKKQLKSFFGLGKPDKLYTEEDYDRKAAKCEDLFEELHDCVKKHGWNDNHCQAVIKPKYDQCIIKRDKIKTQLSML